MLAISDFLSQCYVHLKFVAHYAQRKVDFADDVSRTLGVRDNPDD
jgi:hypothetical protein